MSAGNRQSAGRQSTLYPRFRLVSSLLSESVAKENVCYPYVIVGPQNDDNN